MKSSSKDPDNHSATTNAGRKKGFCRESFIHTRTLN